MEVLGCADVLDELVDLAEGIVGCPEAGDDVFLGLVLLFLCSSCCCVAVVVGAGGRVGAAGRRS